MPPHRLHQLRAGQGERQPQEALERAVEPEPGARAPAVRRSPRRPGTARWRSGRPARPRGRRRRGAATTRHCGSSRASSPTSASRCAASCARRSPTMVSASASRRTATSWSSTGLAMSTPTRAAASRCTCGAEARTQPIRRPPQYGLLIPPIDTTRECRSKSATGGGIVGAVQRQVHEGLVDHQVGAGLRGGGDEPLPQRRGHQVAGRVLELRDQVRQPGPGLPQGAQQQLVVPARVVEAQPVRDDPGPAGGERGQRVRVGGRLHQRRAAGRQDQPDHQVQRVLGAVGDHDLFGAGGQAPGGVERGDRLAQLADAGRVVAGAAEVAGQVLGGVAGGVHQLRRGGERGAAEVDHVPVVGRRPETEVRHPVAGRAAPSSSRRRAGWRACPVSRSCRYAAVTVVRLIRSASASSRSAGRRTPSGEPAVGEQAAHRVGQRGVVGAAPAARQGVPMTEQSGQLSAANLRCHGHLRDIGYLAAVKIGP